jgi:hypothetical protein
MMFKYRSAVLPVAVLLFIAGCSSGSMSPATSNAQGQSSGFHRVGNAGHGQGQDFTLTLNPTSATITSGQNVRMYIDLASVGGLAGTINVGIQSISPPPNGNNGFTFQQARYDVWLPSHGTASTYITFGATTTTLKTTYTITIQGKDVTGGCCYGLEHTATFLLTVD